METTQPTSSILPHLIENYNPAGRVSHDSGKSVEPLMSSTIQPIVQEVEKQVYVGIWGVFGYATQVVEKEIIGEKTVVLYPHFERDKEAIQQELAPFFDEPETITYQDVKEYIAALNESYPEYAIDESRGLLSEIRRTKDAMIQRGEKGFSRGVGWYAHFSESGRATMLKIAQYKQDRSDIGNDIDYQRDMLKWFSFFYGCRD